MAITHKEFNFKLHDTEFFGQYWASESIEKVLLVVHGMGEHCGRYGTHFAKAFNDKKIAIITFDQFGHGKTKGKRGHTPGYDANLDSIETMLDKTKDFFPNTPIFLYGHSMGGNLVANFVLRKDSDIVGALISSPMLRLAFNPPAWKLKIGGILKNIYPKFTESTGLEVDAVSRLETEREKYKKDTLNHDKITIAYSLPFFEAGEWAIANAKLLDENIFIFHGSGDRITDYKASEEYALNAGNKASFKLFEGGYHELHNDKCQDEVLNDMIHWITKFS